ncbi:ACT domain-containing protein [Microbispora sp. NPDC049125]|uniref:ACT domain-containing protein n=1 Tax=Microbispora sp. NPDC049125 TaxID=3154929 RepID=UPI003466DA15
MGLYAVTVVGRDRPGMIAEVTRALADRGAIADSSLTMLSGHLAMTLMISADPRGDLLGEGLARRFPGLAIAVADLARGTPLSAGPERDHLARRPAPSAEPAACAGWTAPRPGERLAYGLRVHGPSRTEILPLLTGLLADAGCAITSMTTRAARERFVVAADVELPGRADVASLMRRMAATLPDCRISFRPADAAVM